MLITKFKKLPKWLIETIIYWPIILLALWISDVFFEGMSFEDNKSIFISSFLLTILNLFIKPIILLLTLPLAILSLGLVIPLLNGLFILIVSMTVEGFNINSYFTSVLVAISVSLLSLITQLAIGSSNPSIFVHSRKKSHKQNQFYKKNNTEDIVIDVEAKEKKNS
ncbi:MAG: hypothetical protein CBD16_06385 [Betaproteobacteria bacterium TMED156]|nr:MAG: hypothetical protein CBD16_06385 [Betaproteobacteria bacterium TMED156]|tara:strand:+ start:57 stop:554 length:498 start_codon:yes stop_codon:yes gene_type:complete